MQLSDSVEYLNSLKERKERYKKQIDKLTSRIQEMEEGEVVKDSVKGGSGGIQTYKIEGFPSKEYSARKNRLLLTRMNLEEAQCVIEEQEQLLSGKVADIEKFLAGIDDIHIRRIVNLRCIDNMSWAQVAATIGGGNTESAVKMAFYRYLDKAFEDCALCDENV